MSSHTRTNILGIMVSRVTYEGAVQEIVRAASAGQSFGVTALAVHGLMTGVLDKEFGRKLNSLDLLAPDGQPVRWALNLLGRPLLRERVYGPTLMLRLCEAAQQSRIGVFLFGSTPGVVGKLTENLLDRFPKLAVCGVQPDRFRRATAEENEADIARINASGAGIVFVGRGCPRQEEWICEHLGRVRSVMVGVGAAFDFHAGTIAQAPPVLQRAGLEWLFRLIQEPRRLYKRYLYLNPLYVFLLGLQVSGARSFRPR